MSPESLIRWSGPINVLAGLWTIAISLLEVGQGGQAWIFAVGTILMIFAIFGVYTVQVAQSGLWGLAGFVVATISEVLMMVEGSPQDPLGMLAGALYALGLIALAIGTWRGRVFSRRVPGLWFAAIVIGLPAYALGSPGRILLLGGSLAFGLGFIVAGYELWTQRATGKAGGLSPGTAQR